MRVLAMRANSFLTLHSIFYSMSANLLPQKYKLSVSFSIFVSSHKISYPCKIKCKENSHSYSSRDGYLDSHERYQGDTCRNAAEDSAHADKSKPSKFPNLKLKSFSNKNNFNFLKDEIKQGGEESMYEDSSLFPTKPSRFSEKERLTSEARDYAIRLLAARPQSVEMLKQKLINREYPSPIIEYAISEMQRLGFQSDKDYAEVFARSHFNSQCWGPIRIRQELKRKGVASDLIESAIELAMGKESEDNFMNFNAFHNFAITDEDGEDDELLMSVPDGFGNAAWKSLMDASRKKWESGKEKELDGRKRRMIGWLQRRGYSWSIVNRIMNELKSQ